MSVDSDLGEQELAEKQLKFGACATLLSAPPAAGESAPPAADE